MLAPVTQPLDPSMSLETRQPILPLSEPPIVAEILAAFPDAPASQAVVLAGICAA
jgi:hypothetical protein